jgi:molybdenum cofactor cytidylyltransferase
MISAMVLAAGRSRRMGAQKLLLPYRGQPLIAHVVDEVLGSPVDHVIVVTGKEGSSIVEALADRRVHIVANTNPNDEMLHSVRCGLSAIPDEAEAAMVALGDQPGITADIVARLVRSFQATPRGIVVPTHKGQRGHPLLFAMRYRREILASHEGRGLRGLLEAHPQDVRELEFGTVGVLEDIDLPQDYARAIGRVSNQRNP